ncbi:MAG: hypothetical protein V3T83_00380 [Acidobacteriota bacterium]
MDPIKPPHPFENAEFNNLNKDTALTMLRLGEAVIGEDLPEKVPDFVKKVDESMDYRKKEQRDSFQTALSLLENPLLRKLLGVRSKLKPFTKLDLADRRRILEQLKGSRRSTPRLLYAGLANLSCSIFYGEPVAWKELQYKGPSVDNQAVLKSHPWRPDDPRPVCDEKCEEVEISC